MDKAKFFKFLLSAKAWFYKYAGGLVLDEKHGKLTVSLGRVSMVVVLVMFVWLWRKAILGNTASQVPDGMLEVFYVLAGYVFGSKITSSIQSLTANKKAKK